MTLITTELVKEREEFVLFLSDLINGPDLPPDLVLVLDDSHLLFVDVEGQAAWRISVEKIT